MVSVIGLILQSGVRAERAVRELGLGGAGGDAVAWGRRGRQGLTLVHFSAQLEPCVTQ